MHGAFLDHCHFFFVDLVYNIMQLSKSVKMFDVAEVASLFPGILLLMAVVLALQLLMMSGNGDVT